MSEATLVINEVNSLIAPSSRRSSRIPEEVEMKKEALPPCDADDVPSWLTEEFVEKVLRSSKKDPEVKVDKLIIRPCSAKGDNYASTMHRTTVHYHSKSKKPETSSLVIKSMMAQDFAIQRLGPSNYDVQSKEMDMYSRIIPEFKRLLTSINENPNIFPEILEVDTANEVIVMEDLVEKNYVMPSRVERLDVVHVKMGLQKLAHMHACSLVMAAKDPNVFERFDTGMFNRKTDALQIFFYSNFEALCELLSSMDGYEYYAQKLKKVLPNLCENATRAFDCDEGDFHVLCHGDFWTNNTLYRYDAQGKPTDIIVIDFQYCHYGSPALDVLYFLHNSTKDEIRTYQIDEMVQYYYYELKNTLQKFNYDMKSIPSFHQFQIQTLKKMFYALTTSLVVLPVMINEDTRDADFEALLMINQEKGKDFKKRIYQNKKYHQILKQMLPVLDRKGLFDEMY